MTKYYYDTRRYRMTTPKRRSRFSAVKDVVVGGIIGIIAVILMLIASFAIAFNALMAAGLLVASVAYIFDIWHKWTVLFSALLVAGIMLILH